MAILALTPLLLLGILSLQALRRGIDVYEALHDGALKGLKLTLELVGALLPLFAWIACLRASGLAEFLSELAAPLLRLLGVPPETGLLMLLRPLSGGGASALAAELMTRFGADSLIARTAAVMIGSSETTVYVIAG